MFCGGHVVPELSVRQKVRAFMRACLLQEPWYKNQGNKTNNTTTVVKKALPGIKQKNMSSTVKKGADSSDTESEDQAHTSSSYSLSRQRTLRRYRKHNRTRIVLKQWLFDNRYYAHATEADLAFLAKGTGLTKIQVSNWINNARRRKLPRILQREGGYRNYYSDSASSSDDYPEPERSPSPKLAIGDKWDIANSNNVQGSGEESKGQEDDDSLIYSWQQAILKNPTGFQSLHPLLRTAIAAKVQAYRVRMAAAHAAAKAGIKSGAISGGSVQTNSPPENTNSPSGETKSPSGESKSPSGESKSPSEEMNSEIEIEQDDPSGEIGVVDLL